MGYGKLISGNVVIEDVALVAGLELNLPSVIQFTDKGSMFHLTKEIAQLSAKRLELVRDMSNLEFAQDEVCEACQKGKIKRSSHKSKTVNSISALLQLIHMNLFGPVNFLSISRKKYALVMVDDYLRYTWVKFMHSKDETPHIIIEHIKKIEKQDGDQNCVKRLRSDNDTEFRNAILNELCKDKGIVQEFSAIRTPHQNGVVERKNRTLVEAAKNNAARCQTTNKFLGSQHCMLHSNRYLINKNLDKSPYSILSKRKPTV
ncbi:hypothetical protein AgCh_010173 [Apium graveolens]